jgi:hypothetical protein
MEMLKSVNIPGWFSFAGDLDPEGRLLAFGDAKGEVHLYGIPE